jgi:hypothetical protein
LLEKAFRGFQVACRILNVVNLLVPRHRVAPS